MKFYIFVYNIKQKLCYVMLRYIEYIEGYVENKELEAMKGKENDRGNGYYEGS